MSTLVYKIQPPYVHLRDGVYYFVRRVPADLRAHYRSDRISLTLRTRSQSTASRSARSINQRLEDYWLGLRLQQIDIPAINLLRANTAPDQSGYLLSDAKPSYLTALSEPMETWSDLNVATNRSIGTHISHFPGRIIGSAIAVQKTAGYLCSVTLASLEQSSSGLSRYVNSITSHRIGAISYWQGRRHGGLLGSSPSPNLRFAGGCPTDPDSCSRYRDWDPSRQTRGTVPSVSPAQR